MCGILLQGGWQFLDYHLVLALSCMSLQDYFVDGKQVKLSPDKIIPDVTNSIYVNYKLMTCN